MSHGTKMILSPMVVAVTLTFGCTNGDGPGDTLTVEHGLYQSTTSRSDDGYFTEIVDGDGVVVATAQIDLAGTGVLEIDDGTSVSMSIALGDTGTLEAVDASVYSLWSQLRGDQDMPYSWCCYNGSCYPDCANT